MITVWDKIKAFIDAIEPLLLIVIPACFGIYLKLKTKLIDEKQKQMQKTQKKIQEDFSNWEHLASIEVIKNIRAICNHYRDIGYVDSVSYIQLENGTIATSELCNMFLTCLAEDSRSSTIPKIASFIQRLPYSGLVGLVDDAKKQIVAVDNFKTDVKSKKIRPELIDLIPGFDSVGSYIIAPVKDKNGYLIGFCLFLYADTFNSSDDKDDDSIDMMTKFVASVETIILSYNESRDEKRGNIDL